jgi:hypothetical protein
MNRKHWRILSAGLAIWMGLASFVSCVSTDDAPAGGRVEHPDPGAKAPPPTHLAPPPAPTPVSSEPSESPTSPSDVNEQRSRLTLSPLDKAIFEDEPSRPWSKNVPKRRCTNDDECGDGFCDRGRCAAIWTYRPRYGQRCEWDRQCGVFLCIDGRCRSCESDAECKMSDVQDPKCRSDSSVPGAYECRGVIGGLGPSVTITPLKSPRNNTPGCQ